MCRIRKSLDQFSLTKSRHGTEYRLAACKSCRRLAQQALAARIKREDPDRYKADTKRRNQRNKDRALADYQERYTRQKGRCAICKKKFPELQRDHCHRSNKQRDLLCGSCNYGLGCFKDNARALRAAADYVERHQGSV